MKEMVINMDESIDSEELFARKPEEVKMVLKSKDVFRVPLMWLTPDTKIDLLI
jgi:hypothetical protein